MDGSATAGTARAAKGHRRGPRDLAARALILGLLGRVRNGALIVKEGGRRHLCGRPVAGEPVPEVEVLSPQVWRAVAAEGAAGLGRAFGAGWWTCADLDELTVFLQVVVRNLDSIDRASALGRRIGRPFRRFASTRPRSDAGESPAPARGDRDVFEGLGVELLEPILGSTMNRSSGIFADPSATLEKAQKAALDRICTKLGVSAADDVLEIGTGWGAFALHAAEHYGCRVTATTASDHEYEVAAERTKRAGLADLVTVRRVDLSELSGAYDKIVAIEPLEPLGARQHERFLRTCSDLLAPAGSMALQTVAVTDRFYDRARKTDDFVKRYVFPGSSLPSIASITGAVAHGTDLQLVSLEDVAAHGAETLRRWRAALAERAEAGDLPDVGDALVRLFEFHLCYRQAGLLERRLVEVQCFFAKPGWRPGGLALPMS